MMMYVHVALLILGINPPVADKFAGMSVIGTAVAYEASRDLGFCWLHKMMIFYTLVIDTCIWLQRNWGFGELRDELQVLAFIWGTVIFVTLLIHRKKFCHECKHLQEVRQLDTEKVG